MDTNTTTYEAHLKNQTVAFDKKERKLWWNHKRSFFKNHRNGSLRNSMKGRPFWTFNSYSFNYNGGLCNRHTGFCPHQTLCPGGEQFMWFQKTSCIFTFFTQAKFASSFFIFFYMQLVRSTIANLCSIMSHFDALDFSECRSEEVISFFWRSVYNFQIVFVQCVRNWLCYM